MQRYTNQFFLIKNVVENYMHRNINQSFNTAYDFTFSRGGCSLNTNYAKVPIFPDFIDNFSPISLPYFPILCKLDNYEITTFTWSVTRVYTGCPGKSNF